MGMFQIDFFKIKKKRKIITNTKKNDAKAFIYIYMGSSYTFFKPLDLSRSNG